MRVVRPPRRWRHLLAGMLLAVAGLAALATPASAARGLTLGFTDGVFNDNSNAPAWFARVSQTGGSIVRIGAGWSGIAARQPKNPSSPDDPAYDWTNVDTAVRQAVAAGLAPVLNVNGTPAWAEGADRPASATPGTWKPDVAAFGLFARAIASRYDGSHPDPANPGQFLPAVTYFQAWNEPNLSIDLTPQWTKSAGKYQLFGPAYYRRLLNAFYAGVKAVRPQALVVTAGTAPFGDPSPGGARIAPALFWRAVLCFKNRALAPSACPDPAHFDVLDHHPYAISGPYRKALNVDDVSIPDMGKLIRPLRAAERSGRALPREHHRVWASEVSWDSNPPDPDGVPEKTLTRWIPEMFEELWSEGVDTIFWFLVRDDAPTPSYAATYQSGMYLHDGTPKPSQQAFRFPVVVHRSGGKATIWARAPQAGSIVVAIRRGSAWRPVLTARSAPGAVLQRTISAAGSAKLRVTFTPS